MVRWSSVMAMSVTSVPFDPALVTTDVAPGGVGQLAAVEPVRVPGDHDAVLLAEPFTMSVIAPAKFAQLDGSATAGGGFCWPPSWISSTIDPHAERPPQDVGVQVGRLDLVLEVDRRDAGRVDD